MVVGRARNRALAAWEALDAPWKQAFDLAWQGYRLGAVPVGAVVASASGSVLARARNHEYDAEVPPGGGLAQSRLAHAELNALALLDPYERHEDATLYSTIEPCALCTGAAVVATVGTVAYAARDAYAGVAGQVPGSVQTARLPLRFDGPLDGPVGVFGAVLRLELYLRLNPEAHLVLAHRQLMPAVHAAAEELRHKDVLPAAMKKHRNVRDVIAAAWPVLVTAASDTGPGASSGRSA